MLLWNFQNNFNIDFKAEQGAGPLDLEQEYEDMTDFDFQVKIAFSQFDTNGDDRMDYREFCIFIRNREEQRNMGK